MVQKLGNYGVNPTNHRWFESNPDVSSKWPFIKLKRGNLWSSLRKQFGFFVDRYIHAWPAKLP